MKQNGLPVSFWKLGSIIFISVMLANLLTLGIVWLYSKKDNRLVITEIEHPVTEKEQDDAGDNQQQSEIELDREQNAQRIRKRTCEFWKNELEKENTERNRLLMEKACND